MNNQYRSNLLTLLSVFFLWGAVASGNGILIPLFKEKFALTQWASQLVDFAYYIAYFTGSLTYILVSAWLGFDVLNRIGHKNGIRYGLLVSIVGTGLFYIAAQVGSYPFLLVGLFVIGAGFSLQQTAAQTAIMALGPTDSRTHRMSLGGGINNLGSMLGPVLFSFVIFRTPAADASPTSAIPTAGLLFLALGGVFTLVTVFVSRSQLPHVPVQDAVRPGLGVLKYPQLVLGMAAIFCYVGTEVAIGSNLGEYLRQTAQMKTSEIAPAISLFWGSLMIGRWTGAISNFKLNRLANGFLTVLVPLVAFGLILGINWLTGHDVRGLFPYVGCIAIMIAAFFITRTNPAAMLFLFSMLGAISMLIGIFGHGQLALFALLSGGLWCSILWPCIFSLALQGLGAYTNQGAACLVMMILGGALIPVLQGLLADSIGIQQSYCLPIAGFSYLVYYGWKVSRLLNNKPAAAQPDSVVSLSGH
jgi:MFS transporter, FHS family, L-fucose permease